MKAGRVWKWFIVCIVLVALGYYASIVVRGVIHQKRYEEGVGVCGRHMRMLLRAMYEYSDDHEGRFPSANVWCDQIAPYVKDRSVFVCPMARNQVCSYALNEEVGGMRITDLSDRKVVVLFESDEGWNATGGQNAIPLSVRHEYFDNVEFADGHIDAGVREMEPSGRPLRKYRPLDYYKQEK